MENCLFCRIAAKQAPAYVVMEDSDFVAFLDIFPLIEGQTVVIPKKHFAGDGFDMPPAELSRLIVFTQKVSKALDSALGSERCMMVLQGYSIDHAHTKLFPVKEVKTKTVDKDVYKKLVEILKPNWYSGFIISMSGKELESDEKLGELADKIRQKGQLANKE